MLETTGFAQSWPNGSSEMAQCLRSGSWSSSTFGAPHSWPLPLRSTVNLVLACNFPMVLLWGRDMFQIYNDGYRKIMAGKHPAGLGQRT